MSRFNTEAGLERRRQNERALKIECLTRYGLNGELRCCWPDCTMATDVDWLTLDHPLHDGAKHRKALGAPGANSRRGGAVVYRYYRKLHYPNGPQTLCLNHNSKSEANHLRDTRQEKNARTSGLNPDGSDSGRPGYQYSFTYTYTD